MLQNLLQNVYRKFLQKMSFGYGFGKNPIIKKILKNLEKSLKTEFSIIQGSKMYLDPGDSLDLSINGVYGELDTKIIRDNIKEGDIVIGISTSGSSANVISALKLASKMNCIAIGFSGKDGGEMNNICQINIAVPSEDTPRIQEMHIVIGHTICHLIDLEFQT